MRAIQAKESNVQRILITEPIAQDGIDLLRYELPDADIDIRLNLSKEHLMGLVGGYSVLIIRSQTCITEELLAKAAHLQMIGRVAGVALDVFSQEPVGDNSVLRRLLAHERVIATPHLGASTVEAQVRVATEVARNIIAALHGETLYGVTMLQFPPTMPA